MKFEIQGNKLIGTRLGEKFEVSACADNSIRFKGAPSGTILDEDWVLQPREMVPEIAITKEGAYFTNGTLKLFVENNGRLRYYNEDKLILEEQPEFTFAMGFRNYRNFAGEQWIAKISFEPNEEEHFFGLGHEPTDCFDLKGCTYDLRHLNSKCAIPYVYSSLGYGFLWNVPSTGRAELTNNRTRFVSDSTKQMDFVVIGGEPAKVTETLTDLTGHAPVMPKWALGFWQCKLRYESQEELLAVARKYYENNIPVSVIVIDYFHWTEQGDYRFDPAYWPNPKEMAEELHKMGMKLMVSMWPTINEKSIHYTEMVDQNMLIRTASGSNRVFDFYGPQAEIDPTNPETREYVYQKLKEGYLDNGVDLLWFDEAEPEIHPEHFDNLILHIGRGDAVGLLYPNYYSKLVYDGMKAEGKEEIVTLSRCAYLGAQKYGTLVWSGDIPSTFDSLRRQIKSGLNMAMCGIPWWTTDIGGFYGGDGESKIFRELIVRWFEYGVFCPVMRLHGSRNGHDRTRDILEPTGGDNEIWSFGERNYAILKDLIDLRMRLIPYIHTAMELASLKGIPVMRPMFFDYPKDMQCYSLGEQYLFGADLVVAPITEMGARKKRVYLPEGNWVLLKEQNSKGIYEGEKWYCVDVALDEIAVFAKEGSEVISMWGKN